jgi:predicted unusual protein kinase regulating ubiquinone biosynthesis (AarF/ABC1/UbiB family)
MLRTPWACQPRNTPLRIVQFVAEARVKYALQKQDRRQWGEWARQEITTMGPAFIKMGQFLSTRSDLFDKEIVKELAKLQDDITPVDIDGIHFTLNESLKRPWTDVFSDIDPTPIACASIGQVHLATLASTGQRVVVKIQKPCVARQIKDDLETLRNLNDLLLKIGSSRASEVDNVLKQYERFLSAELDYKQEMTHMIHFKEILDGMPVYIPAVYESFCTREILVMEYVPSIKISDMKTLKQQKVDTTMIADTLVNIFLQMIVSHGYVHCDPHPGNIGVLPDGETIVLYDFGNVIELSAEFRTEINNLIFAIYQRDVDEFVEILMKLKVFAMGDAVDVIDIKMFFRSFFQYLETLDFNTLKNSIRNQDLLSSQTGNVKLHVEPDFLALFRVFSLLDGTCSRLDPNFNYIEALTPFTQDLFSDIRFFDYRAKKDLQKLQSYPKLIQETDQNVLRTQRQMNQMASNVRHMEYMLISCAIVSQLDHQYSVPLCVLIFLVWKQLK